MTTTMPAPVVERARITTKRGRGLTALSVLSLLINAAMVYGLISLRTDYTALEQRHIALLGDNHELVADNHALVDDNHELVRHNRELVRHNRELIHGGSQ